jgi:hypothetical protein
MTVSVAIFFLGEDFVFFFLISHHGIAERMEQGQRGVRSNGHIV